MKEISIAIILMLSLVAQGHAQTLENIIYHDANQKLNGLITQIPSKKEFSGVLILPAWKGIDNEAKEAARQLAKEGYIALIADIYGAGNTPTDNMSASKIAGHYKSSFQAYQHRINLALQELIKRGVNPNKIAIIGYCFGGTGALEAARGQFPVAGVVSIHGGLSKATDRANKEILTKVLVQHPANDKSVSASDYESLVNEMNEGGADWQIITYANSGHTFTNPESSDYNELMAKRAWNHLVVFLKEILH